MLKKLIVPRTEKSLRNMPFKTRLPTSYTTC
jgi:hypothetical protein